MIGIDFTWMQVARSALLRVLRKPKRVEIQMTITQAAFGAKLKQGRDRKDLTLPDVRQRLSKAFRLQLSLRELEAIEAGQRKVSSYEFESLRAIFGGTLESYLEPTHPGFELLSEVTIVTRGSRTPRQACDALSDCLDIHYQMANLKSFCGERDAHPIAYKIKAPQTNVEAKRQGAKVAVVERHRLGLGIEPIADLYRLLEGEGVDVSFRPLPGDISGAMLAERGRPNPFVVINDLEGENRQAFSLAHEYAHVLMDRRDVAAVTFRDRSDGLRETRANAFAASFLMPEQAIKDALAERPVNPGRGLRKAPINVDDVARLAASFEVSRTAMIYRLRELKHLRSIKESDALKEQCKALSEAAAGSSRDRPNLFIERFTELAMKAVLTHEISRGKFKEVMGLIGVPEARAIGLLADANI